MEITDNKDFVDNPIRRFDSSSKEVQYDWSLSGYPTKRYKSAGFCEKCVVPFWGDLYVSNHGNEHEPSNCRNPPFCHLHETVGHAPTPRCWAKCKNCGIRGHIMRFCRKIKECVLCGKKGHNPLNCFKWSGSMEFYMRRTKELNRCVDCLTLFTTDTNKCTHCFTKRIYWHQWTEDTESQTETNVITDQESQMELQKMETIINNQKLESEEIKKKVAVLEGKLKNTIDTINSLSWQLQATIREREKALHRANTLNQMCQARDLELIDAKAIMEELQAEISQKDFELKKQSKTLNAQPPFPNLAPSKLENTSELQLIKSSLEDLQAQQQQIAMIVNYLFNENRIKTPDTTNYLNSYPSFNFNPYIGLWDTGQNSNKLQQV